MKGPRNAAKTSVQKYGRSGPHHQKHAQQDTLREQHPVSVIQEGTSSRGQAAHDRHYVIWELRRRQQELEQQNHDLRRHREQMSAILALYIELYNHAPVGCILLDSRGVIHGINQTAAHLLGEKPSRLTDVPLASFVSQRDTEQFLRHLHRCSTCADVVTSSLHLRHSSTELAVWLVSSGMAPHASTSYIQTIILEIPADTGGVPDTHQPDVEQMRRDNESISKRNRELVEDLDDKTRALAALALEHMEKHECFSALEKKLRQAVWMSPSRSKRLIRSALRDIRHSINNRSPILQQQFSDAHREFIRELTQRYPDLTPVEIRLCCLLRMNLTTKEAAQILHTSEKTVENQRYRLRRKFRLPRRKNLTSFLASL